MQPLSAAAQPVSLPWPAVREGGRAYIVKQAEVLVGLLDGDGVHEASGVGGIGARLAIDLHQTLHEDVLDLLAGQCILQPVAQQDDERQALTQLVRTGGRARGPDTAQLVKHPVLGRIEALQVLLGTASHTARSRLEDEKRGRS
eukprot:scaffold88602_cov64-Phaeocystis_antarctica.AAC.1